jgi:tRNA-splicing ligase RtcB (3'-phosphate/5'-hydroxy nucleic acid ligase)
MGDRSRSEDTGAGLGKAWNGNAEALIDEDPRADEDIGEVMANQADLVTIEHTLHQILNDKGT